MKTTSFDPYCFELSLQIQSNIYLKGLSWLPEEQGVGNTKYQFCVTLTSNSYVKLSLQNSSFGEVREESNHSHIKMTENQDKVSKENHIAHAVCLNANKIVLVVSPAIRRLF